jgi:hypothetical protein
MLVLIIFTRRNRNPCGQSDVCKVTLVILGSFICCWNYYLQPDTTAVESNATNHHPMALSKPGIVDSYSDIGPLEFGHILS